MARTPREVTDAELAVLQVLWDRGPSTVRALTESLYPAGTTSQYATVQKLLERLEAKRCVRRDRKPWPHLFRALVNRAELIGRQLRTVAEKLCGGSMAPLLTHLLRVENLSPREIQELRAFMDELDRQSQS